MDVCEKCGKVHVTRHGTPACSAHKAGSPQEPCKRPPMKGLRVCRVHGGATPNARKASQQHKAEAAVKRELLKLGYERDVSPSDAMLEQVREAAHNVAVYRTIVRLLLPEVDQGELEADAATGFTRLGQTLAVRVDPEKFHAEPHVFVSMYDKERDRLVKYAKMCRDAGVEEARVRIAEEQGQWLVRTIDMVFTRLQLTPEQADLLPTVMMEVIGELEVR